MMACNKSIRSEYIFSWAGNGLVLLGTIVNGLCILAGSLLGRALRNIPEKIKETVMYAIGLAILVMGLQMGMKSGQFLFVILSLVAGAVLGEWWNLEGKFNLAGRWLEKKLKTREEGSIAKGFISASLLFIIGAMAILGALDSGLRGNHEILYTKAALDGFTAIILSSTLGIGVLFSAVPVFMYQGAIALSATLLANIVPAPLLDAFINEITAVGGIMILAIGLNMIGLTKIRVANLLPAILITAVLVIADYCFGFPI